jgi:cell division protein FtsB
MAEKKRGPAEADAKARRPAEADAKPRRPAEADAKPRRPAEADAKARRPAEADAKPRRPAQGKRPDPASAEAERNAEAEAEARELRRAHLTGRAAILAVVACAIALSLAYPVREYIAQRREIAQLRVQQRQAQQQVEGLAEQKQRLGDEAYIRREARSRLHMCDPGAKCYVVLGNDDGGGKDATHGSAPPSPPWYVNLWRSVDAADRRR